MWMRAIVAVLALVAVHRADAHLRSESTSAWRIGQDAAEAVVAISAAVARPLLLPGEPPERLAAIVARHVAGHLELYRGDRRCVAATPTPLESEPGFVRVTLRFHCPGGGEYAIESRLLVEVTGRHLHVASVRFADGHLVERLLDGPSRQAIDPASPRSIGAWLRAGVLHIATGADHLAFLVALLLAAGTRRRIVWAVTGFTAGHALSLGLAACEVVRPPGPLIESLVGFTVALTAARALAVRGELGHGSPRIALALGAAVVAMVVQAPSRLLVGLGAIAVATLASAARADDGRGVAAASGGFGLIHGFAVAGALADEPLPVDRLLPALAAFNLGVEFGQLAFVMALLVLAALCTRLSPAFTATSARRALASALLALGTYWFVTRASGGA